MTDSSTSSTNQKDENTIKILIATDNHLGYEETDPVIGDDSFIAFEEILQKAVDYDVDMILLGGDLFHHNNPSQRTFNRCMALLRKYTMGGKEIYLNLLASQDVERTIEGAAPVNYMDLNLNISIPVFSIHGNHDDPSGVGLCSSMDTLSSAGLVNYFGKKLNLEHIQISPIILQKGSVRLALYGLSHIKDERLARLFLQDKVGWLKPSEAPDEWFNLFVLHQNRADRGVKRFINESYLPNFLDVVIWGHEHDCEIIQEQNPDKGFFVIQPGSSVPTSLSEGESKPKHVGLLEIKENRKFRWKPIPLQTTRPFLFKSIKLADVKVSSVVKQKKGDEIYNFCKRTVEDMIEEAKERVSGNPKQPCLPLIRLRCEFTNDTQLFNVVKFGQEFYGRVANPDAEIIRFKKLTAPRDRTAARDVRDDLAGLEQLNQDEPESFSSCVEAIVEKYFELYADKKMTVLGVKAMGEAVKRVIEKGEGGAIETVCKFERDETLKRMLQFKDVNESNIEDYLKKVRDEKATAPQDIDNQLEEMFNAGARVPDRYSDSDNVDEVSLLSDNEDDIEAGPPRRGRGARGGRARGKKTSTGFDDAEPAPVGRGRGRGSRGGRARATRAPRGGRASSTPTINSSFPPGTVRSTPVRSAAQASQAALSQITYDDYDDFDQ